MSNISLYKCANALRNDEDKMFSKFYVNINDNSRERNCHELFKKCSFFHEL